MSLFRFCLCWFAIVMGLLSPKLAFSQSDEILPTDVVEFIRQQREIRVYVQYRPNLGMGHLSASVHLMDRLIELGFKGQFTIVYDQGGEEIIEQLLPGLAIAQGDYSKARLPIGLMLPTLRAGAGISAHIGEEVALGITGGDDYGFDRTSMLKVRAFLNLDPLDRNEGNKLWIKGQTEPILLPNLIEQPYYYRIEDRDISVARIEQFRGQIEALQKGRTDFLVKMTEAMLGNRVDVLPFYESRDNRQFNIETLVHGLKIALESNPEAFKDIIYIPLFNHTPDVELDDLKIQIEKILKGPRSSMALLLSMAWGTGTKIKMDIARPQSLSDLPQAERVVKKIVLVPVGSVPREVFEMIFAHSTLPPIFNGRNTANLMLNRGRPFIMTPASFRGRTLDLIKRFGDFRTGLLASMAYADLGSEMLIRQDRGESVAKFLIETRKPGSAINRVFVDIGKMYQDVRNDRFVHGLQAVLREIGFKSVEARPTQSSHPFLGCEAVFSR